MAINADGSLKLPIDINRILMVTHFICCLVGLPLNVLVGAAIVSLRRLRCKPRNIFILGIFNSNFLSLSTAVIEMVYYLSPSEDTCSFYVSVVGLPYVIFFLNLFLALIDRYLIITRSLWHRDNVTVRGVFIVQVSLTAVLCFALKAVYIFQVVPLRCEIQLIHGKIVGSTLLILFLSCLIAQFVVYQKTRDMFKCIPVNTSGGGGGTSHRSVSLSTIRIASTRGCHQQHQALDSSRSGSGGGCIVNWESSSSLTPMEIEATKTLMAGVISLLVITAPLIIFMFPFLVCSSSSMQSKTVCVNINWLAPYFKELPLVHAVVQPILYIYWSDEFSSVIRSRVERWMTVSSNRCRPVGHPDLVASTVPRIRNILTPRLDESLDAPVVNDYRNQLTRQFAETSL